MNWKMLQRAILLFACAVSLQAQMTVEQRVLDFQNLASLYAKMYAPYDWKKQFLNYDLLDLAPWLAEVRAAQNDVEYLDLLVRYVAKFDDTHSSYRARTNYSATLGFHVDGYFNGDDYIAIIDSVTRAGSPLRSGDTLESVDGVTVTEWVKLFRPYVNSGNDRSRIRLAINLIASRSQSQLPKIVELGDTAVVRVRRGEQVLDFTIPWAKSGTPLTRIASIPLQGAMALRSRQAVSADEGDYLAPLRRMQRDIDDDPKDILNYGSRPPIWTRPTGFVQRLGSGTDFFFSGTVTYQGKRIGIVRIPNFSPASNAVALRELDTELDFLRDNTDGLVLDVTRNTGGDPCLAESILTRFMDQPWQSMGRLFRPVWADVYSVESSLAAARASSSTTAATIELLETRLRQFREAYESGRGLTGPLSNCALDLQRVPSDKPYTKPVVLLTDEFSTSAGDYFPAIFQENRRGRIYGTRTNGAGGSVTNWDVGFLSEIGIGRVTISMHWRPNAVSIPGYPTVNFTENLGIHPDIPADLVSVDNYRSGGRIWTTGFLDAIVAEINK